MVKQTPRIYVLAGTNGAGKSSIAGAMLIEQGVEYFNPDAAAALIAEANPGITLEDAQSAAWYEGRRLLERAIAERLQFAFETTLGGTTITELLERAIASGIEVRIWYVGLDSVERHIARVRARVEAGGHDIPEERIRERYIRSRLNLIRLMPKLTELRVYDNSKEADPRTTASLSPRLLVHLDRGRLASVCELAAIPDWAKPVVLTALKISAG
ncbi:MAG TPA: zeta toxin family protein [Pyrinomonadaceae bacterium]